MKLKKLIKGISFSQVKGSKDIEISGVSCHSKTVAPGNLFVAKKGKKVDGYRFISEAVTSGASAVVTDIFDPFLKGVVQLVHPDPNEVAGQLAKAYYQDPSRELYLVGVTGTNGKTTLTYMIKKLLDSCSESCGLIGTVEYITGLQHYNASLTTPDEIVLQKYLREMQRHGLSACAMEVSSHALDQRRVECLDFDCAIFTNLSHDHLDYHHSMQEYFEAKKKLFQHLQISYKKDPTKPRVGIINIDDSYGKQLAGLFDYPLITYGFSESADIFAVDAKVQASGSSFQLSCKGKRYFVKTPLIGRFNIYNLLALFALAYAKNIDMERVVQIVANFKASNGRLEKVSNSLNAQAFVDYAHTPHALENVLIALKETCKGKLITVFGCGGDRDKEKRPIMGAIAAKYSDQVIVTSDNPRGEDPSQIAEEVIAGVDDASSTSIAIDRRAAIREGLKLCSNKDDILLVAGKGHETYQIFSHQTISFDDRLVIKEEAQSLTEQLASN